MTATPNLTLARRLIEDSLAPAPPERIVGALATLSTLVARRAEEEADIKLQLKAYTERLRRYPEDVVMATLSDWPDRSQWWPTWFDLAQILNDRVRFRQEMLEATERMSAVALAAPADEPTPEERASGAAAMRELAKSLTATRREDDPPPGVISLRERLTAKRRKGAAC